MNFLPLLALLFIALKLTNYIDWSWWLVTAPLYAPVVIIIGMWVIATCAGGKLSVKGRK
jgi:hypothetical protein